MIFNRDIKNALAMLNEPFPITPKSNIVNPAEMLMPCAGMTIAIDFETTGLRPYRKGHRIISCAFGINKMATAFPVTGDAAKKLKKILADPSINKIAHNMKFEHQWARHCLGVETKGWLWDSMQASHVLDNRQGITSLKRQSYLTLGVNDWSASVGKQLQSIEKEEGANAFNSLKTQATPSAELLRYNALDAFYTFHLAQRQMRRFPQ